jgi:predicted PurR-regulated permease PerM
MTLATCVVVVAALSIASRVMIPITLAILLAFVLAPLVGLLRGMRLGRVPAVLLAVLLAVAVIFVVGGVVGTQVAGLAGDVPRYASTIEDKVRSLQGETVGRMSAAFQRLVSQAQRASEPAAKGPAPVVPPASHEAGAAAPPMAGEAPQKPIPVEVHQPDLSPAEMAQRVLAPALSPLGTAGIVFVVAIFILLQKDDLRDRLTRLFGARDLHRTMMAMDDAAGRLSRYFLTQLALNAAVGCVIGLGLLLIGVPSPVLWGIIAALLRFVPYIGSFIAAALPLALAAAVDPGWRMLVWTASLFLCVELLMGQVVEPLVYGRNTGLSPVSVVVAAIFWGWLWGPIGLILSMPLTLCLVVLGRHVDRLAFLDVLLGDQPALTPDETFYHRMLAGNVDEVQDQAEQLLKDRSLSSYYDEVAIRGLQLASVDAERGVLTDQQVARIVGGVEALLGELSDRDDREPAPAVADDGPVGPSRDEKAARRQSAVEAAAAPELTEVAPQWRGPSAVLCVAGLGPLDEAASSMLAQLLGKHGLGARAVPHATVGSRAALAALDLDGVMMVCLTYASISGTPSHLRYAVRRLRHRLPAASILVGLWPAEAVRDERLRAAIGADCYAASLREAVAACLAQASGPADAVAAQVANRP